MMRLPIKQMNWDSDTNRALRHCGRIQYRLDLWDAAFLSETGALDAPPALVRSWRDVSTSYPEKVFVISSEAVSSVIAMRGLRDGLQRSLNRVFGALDNNLAYKRRAERYDTSNDQPYFAKRMVGPSKHRHTTDPPRAFVREFESVCPIACMLRESNEYNEDSEI